MAVTRISITIPEELVERADREARRLERSRSWLIADAVRRYLAAPRPAGVREPGAPPYASGLGAQRLALLEADLQLTPEQRVKEAERTARAASLVATRAPAHQLLVFDRYEDYLDWKRSQDARR